MALVNIGSKTEQIEYKKSIGDKESNVFYCCSFCDCAIVNELQIAKFASDE